MEHLSLLKAVLLGAIQGATEFLPVSSSGHLVIVQYLLNVKLDAGALLAFDVSLHLGTLLAVVAVFYRELYGMISAILMPRRVIPGATHSPQILRRLALLLIIGTIPAAVIGLLLKDFFEQLFSAPIWAAVMLLVTGLILWFTRYIKTERVNIEKLGVTHSIVIGLAQAVSIIPGISRSGSTISTGIYLGLERDLAARFSFLLSIPAILGATILQLDDLRELSQSDLLSVIAGTLVAFFVGIAAIKWLLSIIRRHSFHCFAIYCWVVGAVCLYFFMK